MPRSARPSAKARCRCCCGQCATSLRNLVTAGLSSASFCSNRQRLAVLGLRLRRLARLRQQDAEVVVVRQAAAEFGDGGVVVGQLLLDRQRLAVLGLRLRRLARLRSRKPRLLWLSARSLRNSVTAGLSSASFCWIASACGTRPPPPTACPSPTAGRRCTMVSARSWPGVRSEVVGVRAASASWSARASSVGRQGVGGLARVLERSHPEPRPAGRRARPAPSDRHRPGRPAATRDSPVGRQRLVRLAGRLEQDPATAIRLRPTSTLATASAPGSAASASRRQHLRDAPPGRPRCGRPCPVRSASSKFDCRQRPPRGDSLSPCRAGRRACRRSRPPTSRAGRAAP